MKRYKKALKLNQKIYEIKKEKIVQKDMTYYSGLRMWTSDEQMAAQLLEQKADSLEASH